MSSPLTRLICESAGKVSGYLDMVNSLKNGVWPLSVSGTGIFQRAQFALSLSAEKELTAINNKPILIICDEESHARRCVEDINQITGDTTAGLWPAKDFTFLPVASVSREYEHQRLEILSKILYGEIKFVVASAESVLQKTIPPDVLKDRTINLSPSSTIVIDSLVTNLLAAGYVRAEQSGESTAHTGQVEGPGQFAVRGAIVDIFPVQSRQPVRLEFWGDDIDTISLFDLESQRRTEALDSVCISPALEVLFKSQEIFCDAIDTVAASTKSKRAATIKTKLARDKEIVLSGITLSNIDKYLPLAYEHPATLFDYIDSGLVCFFEFRNVEERVKGFLSQHNEDIQLLLEDSEITRGLEGYCMSFPELLSKASKNPVICMDSFSRGSTQNEMPFKRLISIDSFSTSPWGGEIRQLIEDLSGFCRDGYSVILLAGSEKTLPILASDISEGGITCRIIEPNSEVSHTPGTVWLTTGCVSNGYNYPEARQALITQAKAMNAKRRMSKKRKGEEIKSLSDISAGDLVVHALHGIGRFQGIKKLELEGITKDYITIQYAGTDVLYVPVTQMDLVSRYIGPRDDAGVKLNKMSSPEWQKTRSRVKKAVQDMAKELTALYAKRASTVGFSFAGDDDWQMDFEERFPYAETDDQLRSIEEIKADMQKPSPMDRLLCGDVGFGKTEVALRAAFKCILSGKQCCILAPTTVLAWQHYQTAIRRMEHFPVKIDLLSRFRTPKQQVDIVRNVNHGLVELIIGTHRLVQKDVKFKRLGLAIIDEEQRFGVAHKERFKELFNGVDVLTLSATPIPRTLNMAMSGIRDMSVIEEPPIDRYPVQTYVIEHSTSIIIQALTKELRRGGQAFYIHNRIETIDLCAARLQERLPDARIAVAHGKISEEELSEIWKQLIEHEIDILVCTTLIETGVDVPNCNTLIIEDSDRLGLSQLYQLRGRVGRSNRRAFAYFTFRKGKVLTEIASKRLDAIREFTQFGSGFRIALRDLEIRGAGSLLGGKQHGHMEAVGYDMYIQLLNQAMAEQRGEAPPHTPEDCLVDIQLEAHIPEKYIENLAQRLDIYRKIAALTTRDDAIDLIDELIDRYGDPPSAIQGLIEVALLRNTASMLSIREISQRNGALLFFMTPTAEQISLLSSQYKGRVMFCNLAKPYLSVKLVSGQSPTLLITDILKILSDMP